ncbi:MAG: signal peptidase I [Lachnospiraceae bacterium]|nr:signal peptidase I [Lachnospiraceae bacterium]
MAKEENKKHSQQIEDEKKVDPKREIISMILYLAVVFAAVYVIITYVGQRTEVNGTSMETTLSDGDNLIMDKLSYHFRDPERYEVVIFPCPTDPEVYYIKRVIGLPGETVQVIDEKVYINGEELKTEVYGIAPIEEAGIAEEPLTLGEDEYFVLGDNRPVSRDSRFEEVGPISRDTIEGRAWLRIYPFTKIGFVK